MICPFMPISASTELTEFFFIFRVVLAWARWVRGPLHGRVCKGGSFARATSYALYMHYVHTGRYSQCLTNRVIKVSASGSRYGHS